MCKESFIKILDNIKDLPTLPSIYMRLNRLLQSEGANVNHVAKIIESDPAIAAKVLRLVNSSFFGFSRKVTQISHAVVLLGFDTVRNAVLSISVFESFGDESKTHLDRREFWKHSIATGMIAKLVAKDLGMRIDEDAFSGGIIHDLGKLVLDEFFPEQFSMILQVAHEQQCPILEAERMVIGTDHAEIGEYLMERWSLPHLLIESTALHHTPSVLRSNPQIVSLVHIGDVLARRFALGDAGDAYLPRIDPCALDELNLSVSAFGALTDSLATRLVESDEMLKLVK